MESTLAEVCSLVTDGTHDTPKRVASGYPLIKAKEIVGGRIDFDTCDQISEEEHRKVIARSKPEFGDTLFTHIGASLGEAAFVNTSREFSIKNIALFKPNLAIIDSRYLYYIIISPTFQGSAKGTKTGSAQPFLGLSQLRGHRIWYHRDVSTQRRIAGILSAYDNLIENNFRRIKILEDMARSLYREWFVNFRFPGHEKIKMVDSSLGKIPEGWEIIKVQEIVQRISSGKKYDNATVKTEGLIPVLDQGRSGVIGYHDEESGVIATEDDPVIVFANHTCYQRIIQFPFSAIQNVLPFRPLSSKFRNIYWLHWATKDLVKFNDYKGHWPEYMAKSLIFPPAEICQQFGIFVKPILRLVYKLENKNINLSRTRNFLLLRLLSGQVNLWGMGL